MRQIYEFDQSNPPVLNENMIYAEIEKRRVRSQTAIIAVAGILIQIAIVLLGFLAYEVSPWITMFCILYVLFSATGGGVIAVVFSRKGGVNI